MACTIRVSPKDGKNPSWRTFTVDRPILNEGDQFKIRISRWTLHPYKRKLLEQMNIRMADFVYRLGEIVGLKDTMYFSDHSFSLAACTPGCWAIAEDLVVDAFKEAYGFEELYLEMPIDR